MKPSKTCKRLFSSEFQAVCIVEEKEKRCYYQLSLIVIQSQYKLFRHLDLDKLILLDSRNSDELRDWLRFLSTCAIELSAKCGP